MTKNLSDYSKEELIDLVKSLKRRKKYGLVWEVKPEKVVELCESNLPVLAEEPSKSVDLEGGQAHNYFIEGDNYHALSVLNYTHTSRVDVIYIDPPYNTGNKDFLYNDHYVDKEDTYKHSKWLSFMSRRLALAANLLSDDGVMFISIDNNEYAQLKQICDEIMPQQYVTTLHVQMSTVQGEKIGPAKKGNIVKNGEYILVYSKRGSKNVGRRLLYDPAQYDSHYSLFLKKVEEETYEQYNFEQVLAEKFNDELSAMGLLNGRGELPKKHIKTSYEKSEIIRQFIHDNAEFIVRDHDAGNYNLDDTQTRLLNEGKVITYQAKSRKYLLAKKPNGGISQRIPLSDKVRQCHDFYGTYGVSTIRGDWWPGFYLDMGNVAKEGGIAFNNGKKPVRLIKQLLYMVAKENAIVLDFFAGSGTTAQAVLELNKEIGTKMQFIINTYNEENSTISVVDDYCYPRLMNVLNGYRNIQAVPANLKYFKTAFVSKKQTDDQTRAELVTRSVDMICLREDAFDKTVSHDDFKVFSGADSYAAIIFDPTSISDLKKEIDNFSDDKPVYIYVFSLSNDTYESDFADLERTHELRPIPESILEVYRRIFTKQAKNLGA